MVVVVSKQAKRIGFWMVAAAVGHIIITESHLFPSPNKSQRLNDSVSKKGTFDTTTISCLVINLIHFGIGRILKHP